MKDFAHIQMSHAKVEAMSMHDLRAYKDALIAQISDGCAEEDAIWGKIARVNAYIRAAGKDQAA
jgi:hypothetical protein